MILKGRNIFFKIHKLSAKMSPSDQVVINRNIFSDNCAPDEPFNSSVTLKTCSSIIINKFISNCKSNWYNYCHNYTKECLRSCNIDAPYEYGNACVNICPEGYNIDFNNKCL